MQPVSKTSELLTQLTATFSPQASHCPPPVCLARDEEVSSNAALSFSPMKWTYRGHYHLNRGEIDLAIDCFTKALQEAEKNKDRELMSDSLKNLGRAFLEKELWVFAAKIFNAALAVLCGSPNQTLLVLMAEVERRYLQQICGIKSNPNPSHYILRRITLQANRETSKRKIQEGEPVQNNLSQLTQAHTRLLVDMIETGFTLFGETPCKYTLLGLGSFARQEMSPFSDLEFAFLVEKSSPKELEYFRKLTSWLELQVIHLGETAIPILEQGRLSPVQRGFSFDEGGNTPLGKRGYVELIKTPEELAQFQSERIYHEDLVLSNVLRGANFVVGCETLYQQYLQAMQVLLQAKSSSSPLLVCQQRALHLITGHLVEFKPRVDSKKEETPVYNIKHELYRLPSFLIGALADYFSIAEQNTWKKIEALFKLNILSQEGAQHLQRALASIMSLRVRCHLHYGEECEDVYHPAMQIKGMLPHQRLILSDDDVNQIIEIYRVIFPLHRIFTLACQAGNFAALANETFFDNSLQAQAEAYAKLHQYDTAKKCFEQSVALNPEDPEALLKLSNLLLELAEYSKAQEYVNKVLKFDSKHHSKAISIAHNLQGSILWHRGDSKTAIFHYNKSLELSRQIYGVKHHRISALLNNLGTAWQELGDAKKAISYYEESLRMIENVYGEEHPNVAAHPCNLGSTWLDSYIEPVPEATILNNMGTAWLELGDAKKALTLHEEALRIHRKTHGDEHPCIATDHDNLGNTQLSLGNPSAAIHHFEESLRFRKRIFGDEHPSLVPSFGGLCSSWRDLGDDKQAMGYCQMALQIANKHYGNEHSEVATALAALGGVLRSTGNVKKAIGCYEEALNIRIRIFGEKHPDVAKNFNNLGFAFLSSGEFKKAIIFLDKALSIGQEVFSDQHPLIATCYNNLGIAWQKLNEVNKAIPYIQKALDTSERLYGKDHPEVATYLNNLACAWNALGDKQKAIIYYKQALEILTKAYGEDHPHVKTIRDTILILTVCVIV